MHNADGIGLDERVVGFDARELAVPDWLQERRDQYLLQPEVEHPISADERVWPSIFSSTRTATDNKNIRPVAPDWIGLNSPLWDDLGRLTTCLDDAFGKLWQPCRLIAVSVLYGLCSTEEQNDWDNFLERITPTAVSKSWEFLGYDICDAWVLSALMNCGYMPDHEDVKGLRDRFAPHLNDHHLFDDLQNAEEFRDVSNRRVKEHAPFFIYGIYSIPGDNLQ